MKKTIKYLVVIIVLVALLAGGGIWHVIRGSIAQYDGIADLQGLNSSVTIERDDYGIPTINASNRIDLSRALGFTHAQERFFQMDLLRRKSAGELSELVGAKALELDKKQRLHQFRKMAQASYALFDDDARKILEAYVDGVNEGLHALDKKPWEYYLLNAAPKEWLPEDSLLVGIIMFQELQDSTGEYDLSRGYMSKLLPLDVYEFFVNNGTAWNGALDESMFPVKDIPPASSFSYIKKEHGVADDGMPLPEPAPIGSNNWAMDGRYTGGKGAIVACDMHLTHTVPNIWYRARFDYNDGDEAVSITGVTMPGTPLMVLGSNGYVAWGLTASEINTTDVVVIDEVTPDTYRTPDGVKQYELDVEVIHIKGGSSVERLVKKTIWGPVMEKSFFGKPTALRWLVHDPKSVNFNIFHFENAKTVREVLERSRTTRIPALNLVVGDKEGNIGWTIIGYVPKRRGYIGHTPVSFSDGTAAWEGCLSPDEYPEIYNPPSGILWTANNRTLGEDWTDILGDGGYFSAARAYQIKHKLSSISKATPIKMLALQLDDEAYFLQRWKDIVLDVLDSDAAQSDPVKRELGSIVARWDGHASVDSVAYYIIRSFRANAKKVILQRVFAPCIAARDDFNYYRLDYEEPLWMIVDQKPSYLHGEEYKSWDEEFMAYLDAAIDRCRSDDGTIDWSTSTWGSVNRLEIRHPLSSAVPFLGYLTDFPDDPVSGDRDMPKVSTPTQGASQRMAVIVGNESTAIFHQPGGQSGNPLSPYYRKGHMDWVLGTPSPLLPGATKHTFLLQSENTQQTHE